MSKKASKKPYNSLPIKCKQEIFTLFENVPPDKKKKDIAAESGISANVDVSYELPILTYSHACSAFETVKAFLLCSRQKKQY